MGANVKIIDAIDAESIQDRLNELSVDGGGLCIILPNIKRGSIFDLVPDNVNVIDLRYGGLSILGGNHPRKEGIWSQYSHLSTGLARNLVVSDSISNSTPIETWKSDPYEMQEAPYGTPLASEEYRHQHNHYQNLLSEVSNFSDHLNGVAIWGDSGAFVPGAKSWGGFFSARSWPVKWSEYTPPDTPDYENKSFDAALVGCEIDVLNAGLDWGVKSELLQSSMAKVGLQVVGFGARNTAAIDVRTEDSDDPANSPTNRRGAWQFGMIIRNALHENSTFLHCENGQIRRGVDLSLSSFSEGAVLINANGQKSGLVFNHGASGEVYGEENGTLVLKGGDEVKLSCGNSYLSFKADGSIDMSSDLLKSLKKLLDQST